jgi:hypothetical protein
MTGRARASRGGCHGERAAAIAATPRSARLRDDGRAPPSQPPPPVTLLRSDRPGSYLAPRPVSTTNSHSWWTDKRGPVTLVSLAGASFLAGRASASALAPRPLSTPPAPSGIQCDAAHTAAFIPSYSSVEAARPECAVRSAPGVSQQLASRRPQQPHQRDQPPQLRLPLSRPPDRSLVYFCCAGIAISLPR